ncbi:MAG TPA: DUF3365 domain-containing protein [Longimicrobiales bacterium]|nr:DUF3365 domain-containing protein [Longimicrobiales bacterium]
MLKSIRWLTLALVLVAAACDARQPDETPTDGRAASAVSDSAIMLRGSQIATAVAQGLAGRLQAKLEQEGPAGAVDFCSRTALALTDSLTAAYPGTTVKRTSLKIRNPKNAPDSFEQTALAFFDSVRTAGGTLPQAYVQTVSNDEVRFYRPLMVMPFCTKCHGTTEALGPGVQAILQERYPEDQAIGYQAGDWRGVIRVSMPRR